MYVTLVLAGALGMAFAASLNRTLYKTVAPSPTKRWLLTFVVFVVALVGFFALDVSILRNATAEGLAAPPGVAKTAATAMAVGFYLSLRRSGSSSGWREFLRSRFHAQLAKQLGNNIALAEHKLRAPYAGDPVAESEYRNLMRRYIEWGQCRKRLHELMDDIREKPEGSLSPSRLLQLDEFEFTRTMNFYSSHYYMLRTDLTAFLVVAEFCAAELGQCRDFLAETEREVRRASPIQHEPASHDCRTAVAQASRLPSTMGTAETVAAVGAALIVTFLFATLPWPRSEVASVSRGVVPEARPTSTDNSKSTVPRGLSGQEAYERGDFPQAMKLLLSVTRDKSDMNAYGKAHYLIGQMHLNGQGVVKDPSTAFHWFRAAADGGHAQSQFKLGLLYHKGLGVSEDQPAAARWWLLAAMQGHGPAQHHVGVALALGRGVAKNEGEAVKWFRVGAEKSHAPSQASLGIMLAGGRGVPKNEAEAVKWFRAAAEKGDQRGQYHLGLSLVHGHGVPKNRAEGLAWLKKAAEAGHEEATKKLAEVDSAPRGKAKIETASIDSGTSKKVSSPAAGVLGVWTGSYACQQGETGLKLSVWSEPQGSTQLKAIFALFPLPTNRRVPSGSLAMKGTFDPVGRRLVLQPDYWIDQPQGYGAVGVDAVLEGDTLIGRPTSAGCQWLKLERGGR